MPDADPYADLRTPGVVCKHGTLKRKCDDCWHAREIELKDAELTQLREAVRVMAKIGDAASKVNDRYIGGGSLENSLGVAIEDLAVAYTKARANPTAKAALDAAKENASE
jgi:hypothetical protein